MRNKSRAILLAFCLLLSMPAWAAAHPGGQHGDGGRSGEHGGHGQAEHQPPEINWSAYPAEFQSFKTELDQLKEQQKGMFAQFKEQRKQIHAAHRKLSEAKRNALKTDMKDLIVKLKSTRHDIQMLSNQKRAAWDLFSQHATAKQWEAAKLDMQAVIARKKEILAKQQSLLDTQKQMIARMQS